MNILKILFLFVFISFFKPSEECSNIYLIRHAEKVRANKSDRDPDLSNKGFLRAENWKRFFIDKNISQYLIKSEEAVNFYYTVENQSLGIRISFALIYITLVTLLLFGLLLITLKMFLQLSFFQL